MSGKPSTLSPLTEYVLVQSFLVCTSVAFGLAAQYQLRPDGPEGVMPYSVLLFDLAGFAAFVAVVARVVGQYRLNWKQRWTTTVTFVLLYLSSYSLLSFNGKYHPSRSGTHRWNLTGLAVVDQTMWFANGVFWQPFQNVQGQKTYQATCLGHFYSPLIRLDRAFVHRTINYFSG